MKRTRLVYGIFGLCGIAIAAGLYCLAPDPRGDEHTPELQRQATSQREQIQNPAPSVEAAPVVSREPAQEDVSTPPSAANVEELTQQVAELSITVARLEQVTRNLEDRLSRATRPLPAGDRTEAGLAGKKAELDAQAKRSQAATAELQRFAARFGIVLDERVLTDPTFPTPLDKQPGFNELRLAATSSLRVLQAVERKLAADLLDRASFQ